MSTARMPAAVAAWHEVVDARTDPDRARLLLAGVLADEVVFNSPAVFSPQEGKATTTAYLEAAMVVLGPTLRYDRELYTDDGAGGGSAVLEFRADLDGTQVHGIDFLRWGADDKLVEFTVMVRPYQALNVVIEKMAAELFG